MPYVRCVAACKKSSLSKIFVSLSKAIFTPMTLSSDDEFIFLTDNQVRLYCLRAKTGDTVWFSDGDGESGYMVQPRLNERTGEENSMVYTIETLRGNIRQHDVSNGDILWEFNCYDLSRTRLCQHSVEAEFRYVALTKRLQVEHKDF